VRYLVDTNVVSELRKGDRCDANVARWFAELKDEDVFLSVLTVGEIRRSVEGIRRRDRRAASTLDGWLERLLAVHGDRLVPVDREIADEWGRLNVPDPLQVVDGLLAATAKVKGLTLATRNLRHVAGKGARVVDPFSPEGLPCPG